MKLLLPPKLIAAIIAAVTIITTGANAAVPYTGTVYTWDNTTTWGTSNLRFLTEAAYGIYAETTYDQQGTPTVTSHVISGRPQGDLSDVRAIFFNYNLQTSNTLRFDSTHGQDVKSIMYSLNPFTVGGFIVEEGAVGFSITSGEGSGRAFFLGNKDGSASYNEIHEDFAINHAFGTDALTLCGQETFYVDSGATFTLKSNDLIDLSGSLNVTGKGTVSFAQGHVAMASGFSLAVQEGATLAFADAVTGLSHTISNAGTVTFGGAVTLSDSLIGFEHTGACVDYKGDTAPNGYAGALDYTIVQGNVEGLSTVTWNGQTKEVVDGKMTIDGSLDYSTYHLLTAGATLDLATELQNNSKLTKVSMQADTSLNVNTDFEGAIEAIGVNNVVNITEGKTLTGSIQNAAITGCGTYVLNSGTPDLGSGTRLDNNWTGTVRIGGFLSNSDTHLDSFVNGSLSTVEIYGITGGYIPEFFDGGTVEANIKLTNPDSGTPAWIWSSGYGPRTITFTGNWSGNGTFRKTDTSNLTFAFSGDISEWRGTFEGPNRSNLAFQGNATEVNAAIRMISSPFSYGDKGCLIVGDGQSTFTTTFTNTVEANSFTVQEHATAVLSGDTTIADSLTVHGVLKLSLDNHATIQIGTGMRMEANQGGEIYVSDNTVIEPKRMYGANEYDKGALHNVSIFTPINNYIIDNYYTIENMSISGSLIDVGEGTTLYLVNVDIHSDTHITDEAAWLDMQATNAWLDENNAHEMGRHVTTEDTTLYLSGDPSQAITMAAGRVVVELTSDMFDSVTMTGTDLWLDMTAIADAFEGADYVALDFRNLAREFSNAMVDVEKLQVNVTLDGETYKQAYAMTDHGTTTTLYFTVPEPTTSTLSLLALAALAARRRRTR